MDKVERGCFKNSLLEEFKLTYKTQRFKQNFEKPNTLETKKCWFREILDFGKSCIAKVYLSTEKCFCYELNSCFSCFVKVCWLCRD